MFAKERTHEIVLATTTTATTTTATAATPTTTLCALIALKKQQLESIKNMQQRVGSRNVLGRLANPSKFTAPRVDGMLYQSIAELPPFSRRMAKLLLQ